MKTRPRYHAVQRSSRIFNRLTAKRDVKPPGHDVVARHVVASGGGAKRVRSGAYRNRETLHRRRKEGGERKERETQRQGREAVAQDGGGLHKTTYILNTLAAMPSIQEEYSFVKHTTAQILQTQRSREGYGMSMPRTTRGLKEAAFATSEAFWTNNFF